MRILVVEDDIFSQKFMIKLMSAYGTAEVASDGKVAVEKATEAIRTKTPYDLITLDIMLPEMDGQMALIEIRKAEEKLGMPKGKTTKIIMTTALDDSINVFNSYRHACDGYVTKPINRIQLQDVLSKANVI
jgi:two-component system, chemotaxis family, chemotaxis protein CheY